MALITPVNMLDRIVRFLNEKEPGLITATRSAWKGMADNLPASAIQEMWATGTIPASQLDDWLDQYTTYVNDKMGPVVGQAIAAGADAVALVEPLSTARVAAAVERRGASLLVALTDNQRRAVSTILNHHIAIDPYSQRQLAQVLRPALGLTPKMAERVNTVRGALLEAGATPGQIEKRLTKLTNGMLKNRAKVVARTELASAYNAGAQLAIEDGVKEGAFDGDLVKEWRTQPAGVDCKICKPLNKQRANLNEDFSSGGFSGPHPPGHPNCRCVVLYRTAT
ncbi:MAG: hypothetical protein KAI73_01550 [Rhodospirillaceae bacterium]|nr:hypothetical protein [Rhodospirillaceae bacterium]